MQSRKADGSAMVFRITDPLPLKDRSLTFILCPQQRSGKSAGATS
jgi:hypothetical protein